MGILVGSRGQLILKISDHFDGIMEEGEFTELRREICLHLRTQFLTKIAGQLFGTITMSLRCNLHPSAEKERSTANIPISAS